MHNLSAGTEEKRYGSTGRFSHTKKICVKPLLFSLGSCAGGRVNTQRYTAAEAYPTRRSLREAEKRARRGQRRTFSPVTPERGTKATAPELASRIPERTYAKLGQEYRVPQIPFPPVRGESEPVNFPIIPEQVDDLPQAPKPAAKRGRLVPRMAILGSLAAATTVIPLNGPPTSAANAEEGVEYGATDVLDVLMDVDPEVAAESEADARRAGAAAARPRQCERVAGVCRGGRGAARRARLAGGGGGGCPRARGAARARPPRRGARGGGRPRGAGAQEFLAVSPRLGSSSLS